MARRAGRTARRRARKVRREAKKIGRLRGDRTGGDPRGGRVLQAGLTQPIIRGGLQILKSPLGRKALTVARQQITRVPGLRRFAGRTRRSRFEPAVVRTGREIAVRPTRSLARRAAVTGGKIAAGGIAFEAGSTLFSSLGRDLGRDRGADVPRRAISKRQSIPFTPGGIVPTDSIVHTWVANGVPFAQLADGRVMVRRKNGTIKIFRRPRPIVLGRNPGVRDLVRADKKIDALLKLVKKRFPARRTAAPARHSQQHN